MVVGGLEREREGGRERLVVIGLGKERLDIIERD